MLLASDSFKSLWLCFVCLLCRDRKPEVVEMRLTPMLHCYQLRLKQRCPFPCLYSPPSSLQYPSPFPQTSNSSVSSTAWTSHWLFLTSRGCLFMETRSFNALLLQNCLKEALVQCLYFKAPFLLCTETENRRRLLKFHAMAKAAVATTEKCLSASGGKILYCWRNLNFKRQTLQS